MLCLVALPLEDSIRIGVPKQPVGLDCVSYLLAPHRKIDRAGFHTLHQGLSAIRGYDKAAQWRFAITHRLILGIPRITYSTQKRLAGARVECAALIVDGDGCDMYSVPSEPGSLLLSPPIQTDPMENGAQAGTPARTGQVQERAWQVLASTLEGLNAECARWTGHQGPTVKSKR